MQRRTFLHLSIVSSAAMGIPFVNCRNQNHALTKSLSHPMFLSHICDVKTLREIGTAYNEHLSSEAEKDQLVNNILAYTTGKSFSPASDQSAVSSFLDKKIKQDFETGKTVVVNGWVLSATEAQQCALFTLS